MLFGIKTSFSISFKKKQPCLSSGHRFPQKSPTQHSNQEVQKADCSYKTPFSSSKKNKVNFFGARSFVFQPSFYTLEKTLADIYQLTSLCQQHPQLLCMQDKQGNTALHLASEKGYWDAITFLCEKEPKLLLIQNKRGSTALHLASMQGHLDVMTFLCEQEPKLLLIKNKQGNTALHLASERGHLEIATWVCQQNLKLLDVKNFDGDTAFHLAVATGHLDIVKHQYGQDCCLIYQQNKKGLLPLEVALYFNQRHVKTFLIQCHDKMSSFFPILCMYVVLLLFKILDFLCKKLLK